jgi:DNA modification methylase
VTKPDKSISSLAHGQQLVYFSDARNVDRILKPESVNLVVTSPPYYNLKDYASPRQIGYGMKYYEYIEALSDVFRKCLSILRPNGKLCINMAPFPSKGPQDNRSRIVDPCALLQQRLIKNQECELSNLIIWDKRKYNNQQIFGSYPYPPNLFTHVAFEFVHVYRKSGPTEQRDDTEKELSRITKNEWREWCFNPIWDLPPKIKTSSKGENLLGHLSPFPEEVPYRLIRMFSFAGDVVLDPFVGSGIGIEIVEELRDVILKQLEAPWHPPLCENAF